ncbi:MAG: FHA domain-containing protein [Myxococcota bacterium]
MSRDNITSMTLVAYVHGELEDGLTSLMGPTGLSAHDLQAALADVQAEEALLAQALGGPRGETLLDDSRRRMLMETAAQQTHKRPLKGKQRHDKRRLHTTGYLLTFISGRYQGSEFPVEVGGEIVIGRDGDLDLVLVEEMVSHEHARIVHPSDGPVTIEDLGSTNGTFVNGIKIVEPTPLREQDRILIGTNILKLTSAKPGNAS